MTRTNLPLVYSCSGCSSAAQSANTIALILDRKKEAEMSCIAGVGGDVLPLVKIAKSGRDIIAIDGCALACCKSTLARHNLVAKHYFILSDFAIPKGKGKDPDAYLCEKAYSQISEQVSK